MKNKFLFLFLLIFAICYDISGQSVNSVREKLLLDFGWRFYLGDERDWMPSWINKATSDGGPMSADFNDASWRAVDLPHDWAVEQEFISDGGVRIHGAKPVGPGYAKTSIGWYRKTISITKNDIGKRLYIRFDGVYRNSTVWLNGFCLGTHYSGYTDFDYDITDFVKYDSKNVLVVRVDASQYEGWFYEGAGIYRHAWLVKHAPLHIPQHGTYITTSVEKKKAKVNVETLIKNLDIQNVNCKLELQIVDGSGRSVASASSSLELPADGERSVKLQIPLENAELWSVDRPYLYSLVSVIKSGDKIIDRTENTFGIRTIFFDDDKGFFLNGERVEIKGTCNHQDHAGVGSALPDRLQYYRIERLKEMGCNAYRTSHNPPTPELLDACDKLGMLVLDETRMLSSSDEYMGQFERLMLRDRNHPSVIAWCIGNEDPIQSNDNGRRIALSMMKLQKKTDPSRLSTLAANNGNNFEGANSVVDIRGYNYNVWNSDEYHKNHPVQPMWGTEEASTVCTRGQYFNDTLLGYVDDYDRNKKLSWTATAERWWKYYDARTYLAGAFAWTGFDYRGETTPYGAPCISSHFGIMDMCGFPKNNFYYYQAWWTNKDVLHLYPHWNWNGKTGDTISVWVQTNCENVELFLNGKSIGNQKVEKNSHVDWKVAFEPGTLEAKGTRNGKTITDKVVTTGESFQLAIIADRNTINADGEDLSILTVTALDDKGREVPVADDMVKFEVSGNGKIIGVGNGNPSSHEPDKILKGNYHRKLFNGKCQVIVQSSKNPGEITIKAVSEKLKPAEVVIKAKEADIRPSI